MGREFGRLLPGDLPDDSASRETVVRLVDWMKMLLEEQEPSAVTENAARAARELRRSVFVIVADLVLADGNIDARERKFLPRRAANFNIRARVASHATEAMLIKNHL
jgi:hypothetical protein